MKQRVLIAALMGVLALPALGQEPAKRLKTDSPVRQKRIREFLGTDAAKREAALAEAAKWQLVSASAAAKDLDLLRKHVPLRTAFKDAKGQPLLKGQDKFTHPTGQLEYAWQVPRDYNPAKPTPLHIYLHGSNGPQGIDPWATWANSKGAILVAPVSPNRTYWHPVAGATDPKDYEETFMLGFLAAWREKFNVDPDRIYLSGFSAGGFGSWWFSLRYPDLWAAVMPMAGGPPANWGERGPYEHPGRLPYWIWHGELDADVPPDLDRKGVEGLKRLGTPVVYKEYPGGDHNTWFPKDSAEIGKTVVSILEKERRIVWPKRVVWTWDKVFMDTFPGVTPVKGAWWLRMGDCGSRARIEGELTAPNVFEIKTSEVKDFVIRISPDMVDMTKPVEVKVNGEPVFSGTLDVDFELLLRDQEATCDPRRLVAAEIRLKVP